MDLRVFVILLIILNNSSGQSNKLSPCPEIFQYRFNGLNWNGLIKISNPPPLGSKINLTLFMAVPRTKLSKKDLGVLQLTTSKNATLLNLLQQKPIIYRVVFPSGTQLPRVTSILYNNQEVCSGSVDNGFLGTSIRLGSFFNSELASQQGKPYLIQNPYFVKTNKQSIETTSSTASPTTPPSKTPKPPPTQTCGQLDPKYNTSPLIFGGTAISRGAWPWLIAIYVSDENSSLSFKCGGVLISSKIVLTAAHCIKTPMKRYQSHEIVVYLGRYNIKKWISEEGSQMMESSMAVIHPDYMKGKGVSFDADIAIIVLTKNVKFNEFIRPICLWTESSDVEKIVGKVGTVIGWGSDENGQVLTNKPRKVLSPIVSDLVCLRSSETFRYITSNRTFCAGRQDGSGPCHGDSGSGLAIQVNNIWVLRGIVSMGVLEPGVNKCNLKEFVVFTDVSKYKRWIEAFLLRQL